MKKLFAILFLGALTSCGSHSKKNDLEIMNLKGSVIGLLNEDNKYYFFNKDGFIEKTIQYNDINKKDIYKIEEYIYTDNLLNKTIEKINNINENIITNYIYNKEKQLIKKITPSTTFGNTYTYFFYNNYGKLIKDSMNSGFPPGEVFRGLKDIQVDKYTYLNDEVSYYEFFENDSKQIVKFKDEFGEFYISDKKIEYEFSKDNIGNWVEKKWNINGEPKINSRIILYKGEDISSYLDDYNTFKSSKGESKNIVIQESEKKLVTCSLCYGTGLKTCLECGGKGKIRCQSCIGQPRLKSDLSYCSDCGGSQSQFCYRCVGDGYEGNCPRCNGTGKLEG